jgi:hypothetical protein
MYVPAHFAADDAVVDELLAKHGAADLITLTEEGLLATMLAVEQGSSGPKDAPSVDWPDNHGPFGKIKDQIRRG